MRKTNKMWIKRRIWLKNNHIWQLSQQVPNSSRDSRKVPKISEKVRGYYDVKSDRDRCTENYPTLHPLQWTRSRHAVIFNAFQVLLWKSAESKPRRMWIDFLSRVNWIFCFNNGRWGKQWWHSERNEDFSAILGRCVGIMWVPLSDHFWSFQLLSIQKSEFSID